ncbi:MAG TPA: DNA-formamidopyrimidine glycosylase family protein, partial [Acidimicrobiales bacterium]
MPEGDTIHRTANRLRPALVGQELVRFEAPRLLGDRPRPGTRIEAVDAVGKHLLIDFADGLTLQTHQRMSGSWHLYRTGERWRSPRHLMRVLVAVDGWEAVDFAAPVVRTYRRVVPGGALGRDLDPVAHLGPDLCVADPDIAGCLARWTARVEPGAVVADVLLDQR